VFGFLGAAGLLHEHEKTHQHQQLRFQLFSGSAEHEGNDILIDSKGRESGKWILL